MNAPEPQGAGTRSPTTHPVSHGRSVQDPPTDLTPTPGQTIGPFFGYATPYENNGLPFGGGNLLVDRSYPGAVRFWGTVLDGAGDPVPDALVEIWQADEHGRVPQQDGSLIRNGWDFTGWGRDFVDRAGIFGFSTVEPGPTDPGHAPFFLVVVFARGLLNRLFTRAYLPEHTEALAQDPLLRSLPAERARTLVAQRQEDGSLRLDIRLQGPGETVFLHYPGQPEYPAVADSPDPSRLGAVAPGGSRRPVEQAQGAAGDEEAFSPQDVDHAAHAPDDHEEPARDHAETTEGTGA